MKNCTHEDCRHYIDGTTNDCYRHDEGCFEPIEQKRRNMTKEKAIKNLTEKFTSGNSIPVERASITLEEWIAISAAASQKEVKK